jgi:DsbC/DsbD-like thiol-disulfide interchange protein
MRHAALVCAILIALSCDNTPPGGAQHSLASVTLEAADRSFSPGAPLEIAIIIDLAEDWHAYWVNPGDAGLAPSIEWDLPDDWIALPVRFPLPRQFEYEGMISYGYAKRAVLLSAVLPGPAAKRDTATIRARATVLVCNESCIAVRDTAVLRVARAMSGNRIARADTAAHLFDSARRRMPRADLLLSGKWEVHDKRVILNIAADTLTRTLAQPLFFPRTQGVFDYAAPQRVSRRGEDTLSITWSLSPLFAGQEGGIEGVIVGRGEGGREIGVPIRLGNSKSGSQGGP